VRSFLAAVPTTWDETRFIDGYPGRLAVLARRRGTDWYVAGISADSMIDTVEVPLRFLGAGTYDVGLISDGEVPRSVANATTTLTGRDTMTVELAPRGGFSARFVSRRPARARPVAGRTETDADGGIEPGVSASRSGSTSGGAARTPIRGSGAARPPAPSRPPTRRRPAD
jgi:hypothetical protein